MLLMGLSKPQSDNIVHDVGCNFKIQKFSIWFLYVYFVAFWWSSYVKNARFDRKREKEHTIQFFYIYIIFTICTIGASADGVVVVAHINKVKHSKPIIKWFHSYRCCGCFVSFLHYNVVYFFWQEECGWCWLMVFIFTFFFPVFVYTISLLLCSCLILVMVRMYVQQKLSQSQSNKFKHAV